MPNIEVIQIVGIVLTFTWMAGLAADFRTHQLHGRVLWFYIVSGVAVNVMIWGPLLWRVW